MWPFICQFIEKLFRETIEPAVRGANTHLSTFSFTKVNMGRQVSSSQTRTVHTGDCYESLKKYVRRLAVAF